MCQIVNVLSISFDFISVGTVAKTFPNQENILIADVNSDISKGLCEMVV